eukprot:GFYU01001143.1.p1 GENE.GFYU01001143.1~~GFYU01001143.1.p1  ORF type:complete len:154 (-),score=49.30 GFYU01001143.1:66-527(-)
MDSRGYKYSRIDGSYAGDLRHELITEFNHEDSDTFVFLLSTRSCNQGINLTAANVVILYDLDFNPQMDRQAEDRVYRLGQKKDVKIMKLLSEDTVDLNVYKIAEEKTKLGDALLTAETEGNDAAADDAEKDSNSVVGTVGSEIHKILSAMLAP